MTSVVASSRTPTTIADAERRMPNFVAGLVGGFGDRGGRGVGRPPVRGSDESA